jgi:hypothetical protein
MWEPRRPTNLWASTAYHRNIFTFFFFTQNPNSREDLNDNHVTRSHLTLFLNFNMSITNLTDMRTEMKPTLTTGLRIVERDIFEHDIPATTHMPAFLLYQFLVPQIGCC